MEIKATAYDQEDNVIMCEQCDLPAGIIISGRDTIRAWCGVEHSPYWETKPAEEPKFEYRPPK